MNLLSMTMMMVMTSSGASINPEAVADQFPLMIATPCSDRVTGLEGVCHIYAAGGDTFYLLFHHDGEPLFIRYWKTGSPYSTVWQAINDVPV